MTGKLYLVATPIGNLEDITLRALRVLREVDLIAAEDTRTTRKLLSAYGIHKPLTSYHDHNKEKKLPFLLRELKEKEVALVSEAGTPGLSDPGYELVIAALERGIPLVSIPGPSAITSALVVSGLPTDQFLYLGFLPRKKQERRKLLRSLSHEPRTLIAFEAPHRLRASLEDIRELLGERRLALCRELTKVHEEVFRGTVSQALSHFTQPRGEFTLVVAGAEVEKGSPDLEQIEKELTAWHREGLLPKEAVARVAHEWGLPKKEVYRLWLRSKGQQGSGTP